MEKISWLRDIIYLLPIGGLIWKMALLHAQVKQNTSDIINIQKETSDQNKAILAALQTLNDSMNQVKVDIAVLKALRSEDSKTTSVKAAGNRSNS